MNFTTNVLIALSIMLISSEGFAQSGVTPFSGTVFSIDNYIGDKFDNTEDLSFTNTTVEGSICVQYGFEPAPYTIAESANGGWTFACTMISKEHGKMVWEGTKKGNKISGSYLWTKEGQDPLQYTFRGKLK